MDATEWIPHTTKSGKILYYINPVTGECKWQRQIDKVLCWQGNFHYFVALIYFNPTTKSMSEIWTAVAYGGHLLYISLSQENWKQVRTTRTCFTYKQES